MSKPLFVYGTLMIPEIQEALLGRKVNSQSAVLDGFSANCIHYGQYITEYPFLKPCGKNKVNGRLLKALTGQDLNLIRYYEGSEYMIKDITVFVENKEVDAITFMLKNKDKVEYGQEWDYDKFVNEHLQEYITEIIPNLLVNYNM